MRINKLFSSNGNRPENTSQSNTPKLYTSDSFPARLFAIILGSVHEQFPCSSPSKTTLSPTERDRALPKSAILAMMLGGEGKGGGEEEEGGEGKGEGEGEVVRRMLRDLRSRWRRGGRRE